MHWHVVAHRDHFAIAVENRAGIIAPFLDVGRKCRAPQGRAHLLSDGVVEVLEDFQFHRIARHAAQFTVRN